MRLDAGGGGWPDERKGDTGLNRAGALRLAACGILGFGAALLVAALLLSTYTASRITKIPLDIDTTLVSSGTATTVLDPASLSTDRFVANMSKAKRRGKIFVDYLRNQRGATAICPFSTRARPGAHVAMPVSWEKLARLDSAHPVAVGEAAKFMGRSEPWPGYFKLKQGLPKLRG